MTDTPDVWAATDAQARPSAPTGDGATAEGIGEPIPVTQLFTDTLDEFKDHWQPYMMTGFGLLVLAIPVTVLLIVVAATPMFAGILGEIDWLVLAGFVWYAVALFGGLALLMAPLNAGLFRAVNRHLDGEEGALGFGAIFGNLTQDLVPVVVLHLLIALASMIGLLLCYLPALIVNAAVALALPALVVHRLGPTAAIGRSVRHFRDYLGWHIGFWALGFAILMVAGNVPIIGYAFGMPFYAAYHLRAYRHIYGTGAVSAEAS